MKMRIESLRKRGGWWFVGKIGKGVVVVSSGGGGGGESGMEEEDEW